MVFMSNYMTIIILCVFFINVMYMYTFKWHILPYKYSPKHINRGNKGLLSPRTIKYSELHHKTEYRAGFMQTVQTLIGLDVSLYRKLNSFALSHSGIFF